MSRSRKAMSLNFALLMIAAVFSGSNAKSPSRIQEGQATRDAEFPGVVTLTWPGDFVSTCGGAIIGPRHVLTAAHCINRDSEDISVRAGIRDIRDMDNAVERLVEKVVVHSEYVPQTQSQAVQNDIAILVLKEALPFGPRIQALMLPESPPMSGRSYVVAGWGRNKPPQEEAIFQFELQSLVMKLDMSKCPGHLPRKICAHSDTGSTCSGDSGSPLMRGGRVYGIDSASNCRITESSVFVNVYYYVDWIKDVICKT